MAFTDFNEGGLSRRGILRGGAMVAAAGLFAGHPMGRALLAEPDLLNRIQADGDAVKSVCTHCNQCMATIYSHTHCVVTGAPDTVTPGV